MFSIRRDGLTLTFNLRGLRPEGGDDFGVGFQPRRSDQVKAVGDGGENAVQGFGDGFGLSGEVDNEGVVSDDGDLSGEDGGGDEAQGDASHLFAEAGHFAGVVQGEDGFGGDIARGGSGSAGGEDEVALALVEESEEGASDVGEVVGDDFGVFGPGGLEGAVEPFAHGGKRAVGVDAGVRAVGSGEESDAERGVRFRDGGDGFTFFGHKRSVRCRRCCFGRGGFFR